MISAFNVSRQGYVDYSHILHLGWIFIEYPLYRLSNKSETIRKTQLNNHWVKYVVNNDIVFLFYFYVFVSGSFQVCETSSVGVPVSGINPSKDAVSSGIRLYKMDCVVVTDWWLHYVMTSGDWTIQRLWSWVVSIVNCSILLLLASDAWLQSYTYMVRWLGKRYTVFHRGGTKQDDTLSHTFPPLLQLQVMFPTTHKDGSSGVSLIRESFSVDELEWK